jgi:thiamine kinase-like enzyme
MGPWFSDYGAASCETVKEMEGWFNHKLDICNIYRQSLPNTPRFVFRDDELVLTHQDIAPRNVILDKEGKAWLVDWAFAGAYPRGFERVAMVGQCEYEYPEFSREVCERITSYPVVEMQRLSIGYGLTTAALA